MKKVFLLVTAYVTILMFSCKKETQEIPIGTLKADIGNQASTFNINARATRLQVTGGYGIEVKGYKKDPTVSGTYLSFVIVSPGPIVAGEYTENSNGNPLVEMNHFIDIFLGAGGLSTNFGNPGNPVRITISEINSAFVKGTFRGELQTHDINGSPTGTVSLANGQFYLAF